jgi:tetratricopeptide (TPR) repeat protein
MRRAIKHLLSAGGVCRQYTRPEITTVKHEGYVMRDKIVKGSRIAALLAVATFVMTTVVTTVVTTAALTLFAATPAHAAFNDDLATLQQRWATARYQTNSGDERKTQLGKLVDEADSFTKKYSDKADGYIWAAVIRGSLAEAMNNMSALGVAKEAKANLEQAITLDPAAEESYAYGMLGLMYSRTPGWPVAFGDNKKAQEMLKKGFEISPNGMDINYFNAQYWFDKGEYKKAQSHIEKAVQATSPYSPAAALVAANRQREIQELRDHINAKLK